MNAAYRKIKRSIWKMKKKKIKILHVAQAAGGVDRYIRMLLKYLDKEKFENILVCSQDFREKDYKNLVDFFEQVKMDLRMMKLAEQTGSSATAFTKIKSIESGYWLLLKLCGKIWPGQYFMTYGVIAIIICGFCYIAIWQQSPNPALSVYLFFVTGIYFDPIKRFTTPEEIAQIAKILVSDLGNTIVGQTIYMSGGRGIVEIR